jgi:hypothetical protein
MTGEVQITAKVDLSDWFVNLGTDYLSLFQQEPKIIFCIVFAFMAAQLVHVILRGYWPTMRRLTQAIIIWTVHILAGAISAHNFLGHMGDVEFYKWFTGTNSILLFYVLFAAGRYLKLPWLVQFLSLRISKVVIDKNTGKPVIEMGETVRFLKK